MAGADSSLRVEVFYGAPARQALIPLGMPAGSTAGEAVMLSGLLAQFPEMGKRPNLARFGKGIAWETALADHDRIDVLRPLLADPKEYRRRRAEAQRAGRR